MKRYLTLLVCRLDRSRCTFIARPTMTAAGRRPMHGLCDRCVSMSMAVTRDRGCATNVERKFVAIEEEEWWGVAVAVTVTNQQSACTAAGGFGSGGSVGVVLLLFARLELLWTLSTLLLDKLQAVYCSVLCHFLRAPISFSGGSKHCG